MLRSKIVVRAFALDEPKTKMSKEPRILYVSEMIPRRPQFGAELRCYHIAKALQAIGEVEVAWVRYADVTDSYNNGNAGEFPVVCTLQANSQPNYGLASKIGWTFNPRRSYPYGLAVSASETGRFYKQSENYDLIWFFKLRAAEVFPVRRWSRSVIDIDDLPTTYERAVLQVATGLGARASAMRRYFSWKRRERLLGTRFDALAVCSEEDKAYLKAVGVESAVHVIPNGFEKPKQKPSRSPADPPRFGFVGLIDFQPNRDGLEWFVRKCWPEIKRAIPAARLRVIGRDSENWFSFADKMDGIDRLGWVADTSEEMSSWSAMIVPIRIGAGTRVKIAHGFSQGIPIVSTRFGAFGYGAVDGREMYLADSPDKFAGACLKVVRDPESARAIATQAWELFVNNWTWEAIQSKVEAAARECLQNEPILSGSNLN
jgi:glycosyltransferase involved in cell wall biosynthesis